MPDYNINPAVVTDTPPAHDLLKNGDHLFYLDGDNLVEVIKINGVLFEEKMSRQSAIDTPLANEIVGDLNVTGNIQMDGNEIISSSRVQTGMDTRSYLVFGDASDNTGSTEQHTMNAALNGEGYTIPRKGYVNSISIMCLNDLDGSPIFSYYVYINGTKAVAANSPIDGMTISQDYNLNMYNSGTSGNSKYEVFDTPLAFNAGTRIGCELVQIVNEDSGGLDETALLIEIVT